MKYEKKLLEKRDKLLTLFNTTKTYSLESEDAASQDIADKASSAYNKEFLLNLTDTERRELQLVENALERIISGTYGTCMTCGCKIMPKRLDAVPWAAQCIKCKEQQENSKS
jgi:DnaK suppressor protein